MYQAYKAISELPGVDEAIRALLADHTEDNAVCLVQAIMEAQKPTGVVGVERSFIWNPTTQQHIPTLHLTFSPVPGGLPNNEKGWADRDALAERLK